MITDIQMPLMTGKQLCQALVEKCPERNFPIFVMTSKTDREEREWTATIARLEFLEKPLSMRALVARLDRHFGTGQVVAGAPDA
jgi:DNA-binding response OmpR family regulator